MKNIEREDVLNRIAKIVSVAECNWLDCEKCPLGDTECGIEGKLESWLLSEYERPKDALEKLGYKIYKENVYDLMYHKDNFGTHIHIDKTNKSVEKTDGYGGSKNISLEEIKALNEVLEDLK